ncbi:hypothetical protein CB1_001428069 [Camelus ferus]|nr:hypothetical protein CB1_001428069 [Camelus ferus]
MGTGSKNSLKLGEEDSELITAHVIRADGSKDAGPDSPEELLGSPREGTADPTPPKAVLPTPDPCKPTLNVLRESEVSLTGPPGLCKRTGEPTQVRNKPTDQIRGKWKRRELSVPGDTSEGTFTAGALPHTEERVLSWDLIDVVTFP